MLDTLMKISNSRTWLVKHQPSIVIKGTRKTYNYMYSIAKNLLRQLNENLSQPRKIVPVTKLLLDLKSVIIQLKYLKLLKYPQ